MAQKCENCGSYENGFAVSIGGVTAHILDEKSRNDVEHINTSARLTACRECGFIKNAFLNISNGIPISSKKTT